MAAKENFELLFFREALNELLTQTPAPNTEVKLNYVVHFLIKNISEIDGSETAAFLNGLLKFRQVDEQILERNLQIFYQVLKTIAPDAANNVFCHKILDEVIVSLETNKSTMAIANILACVQLYAEKFNDNRIIQELWHKIKLKLSSEDNIALQILVTLFDDFAEHVEDFKQSMPQLTLLIQSLLHAEEHDSRKCAYFLLKKTYPIVITDSREYYPMMQYFWTSCISIFESLEDNQSHLILPTLELLRNMKVSNKNELTFLKILYARILQHSNILVRRWMLEYLLTEQTIASLDEATLLELMQALNDTSLYNIEGYMLSDQPLLQFLSYREKQENFFRICSQIHWRAVPLYYWLTKILNILSAGEEKMFHITQDILLDFATKIRGLQHVNLRRQCIEIFEKIFINAIEGMTLPVYVQFVEALYNYSDTYSNIALFCKKLTNFDMSTFFGNRILGERCYNIITNGIFKPSKDFEGVLNPELVKSLSELPVSKHGYLRFLIVFDLNYSVQKEQLCQELYNFNVNSLYEQKSYKELYETLCKHFECSAEERNFIKRKLTEFFLQQKTETFDNIGYDFMDFEEILSVGSTASLLRLSDLLAQHTEPVHEDLLTSLFDCARTHLKSDSVAVKVYTNFLSYCENVFAPLDCAAWIKNIFELDFENVALSEAVVLKRCVGFFDVEFLLKGALFGIAKAGDARIEEAYSKKYLMQAPKQLQIRQNFVKLMKLEPSTVQLEILYEVTKIAKKVNIRKPRYFAHSREHRELTRLGLIMWELVSTRDVKNDEKLFDALWTLLMEHNNQPNVLVLYECAMVQLVEQKTLFNKIKDLQMQSKCTASQIVSLVMLLYRFYERNLNCVTLSDIEWVFSFLWPLTMGASFQCRLYAQLVTVAIIDNLEKHFETCSATHTILSPMPTYLGLKRSIIEIIGKKQINDFFNDYRFISIKTSSTTDFSDHVMFLTNMTYDEYNKTDKHFADELNQPIKKLTDLAKAEVQLTSIKSTHENKSLESLDVQRKLNPTADFIPTSSLSSYPECYENELYVVASLIDKIPNLGGIARTCEVLGAKNLVLDTKAHTTKPDFKNLSMTAEKTLNIIEVKSSNLTDFLMQKKIEGFQIVGAEQTQKSCSFVDFVFPKKSVLLLGHEKEGIPPNLLGFLDFAVEIPQFGMVRSLNVHVTGALFMWEYCKQNIVKRTKTK